MLAYFVIILVTLVLFSVYTLNLLSDYLYNQNKVDHYTKANIISGYVATRGEETLQYDVANMVKQLGISTKTSRILVLDTQAKVRCDTNYLSDFTGKTVVDSQVFVALGGASEYRRVKSDGDIFVVATVPIIKDGQTRGVIYMRSAATEIQELLSHFSTNLIGLSVILSIIIGLFSFVLASVLTNPISQLTKKISEITKTDLSKRLDMQATGEVGELAASFVTLTDELQNLEEKRQEFVSNASHELKTPLSSIKLICDSLVQNDVTDPAMVKEFLQDMNREVDRLNRIVNKLLDLTKMDVKKDTSKETFVTANLKDVVEGVVASLRALAEKKGIRLTLETQNDVFMLMDEDRIWEAIYNIIDNSIKYTGEDGTVEVYLERDETNAVVTVKDNGIGMESSEISKIFDRFYRIDKARARETGGTGLGLSIALSAVKMHDGHIEVTSEEGQGSTFRIFFNIA